MEFAFVKIENKIKNVILLLRSKIKVEILIKLVTSAHLPFIKYALLPLSLSYSSTYFVHVLPFFSLHTFDNRPLLVICISNIQTLENSNQFCNISETIKCNSKMIAILRTIHWHGKTKTQNKVESEKNPLNFRFACRLIECNPIPQS